MYPLHKRIALAAIAGGLPFPETAVDRVVELRHLKHLLDSLKINCVLDVGANKGQFAREVRGIGFKGLIVSFEPVQREFSNMASFFKEDPLWRGYAIALSDTAGRANINVPRLTVLSSFLQFQREAEVGDTEEVEMQRLDDIFEEAVSTVTAPRILLKMDTQGYDVKVFEGAAACRRHIYALQSELSVVPLYKGMPHYLDALRIYELAGFALHHLSVVARSGSGALQELNCLMRRRSS